MQLQHMPLADQHAFLTALIAGAHVRKDKDGQFVSREPKTLALHSTAFHLPKTPPMAHADTDGVQPQQPLDTITLNLTSGGKIKQITPQNVTKDNEPRHLRPWIRWSYASKGAPVVARMTTEGVRRLFALSDILESDALYNRAPRA